MTHIWHKVLAKRDIRQIWGRRSNGTYDFVYSVIIFLKCVADEMLIIKGACAMAAVRLGTKTGFGMGKSLGRAGSELCCCVFGLDWALGCKATFIAGAG